MYHHVKPTIMRESKRETQREKVREQDGGRLGGRDRVEVVGVKRGEGIEQ